MQSTSTYSVVRTIEFIQSGGCEYVGGDMKDSKIKPERTVRIRSSAFFRFRDFQLLHDG